MTERANEPHLKDRETISIQKLYAEVVQKNESLDGGLLVKLPFKEGVVFFHPGWFDDPRYLALEMLRGNSTFDENDPMNAAFRYRLFGVHAQRGMIYVEGAKLVRLMIQKGERDYDQIIKDSPGIEYAITPTFMIDEWKTAYLSANTAATKRIMDVVNPTEGAIDFINSN